MKNPPEPKKNPTGMHLKGGSRFCVAPMMDWSDRHCRYLWRLISKNALLYTEMITSTALLQGNRNDLLDYNEEEHPLALQLGGSNPNDLAQCAKMAEHRGYDEVNLNCGCPSPRVQNGRFGACLMKEPQLVSDCVKAMLDAVDLPVTVKHRIGVDDQEDFNALRDFVGTLANAGCRSFVVHARKAWLQGLSPKENREKPPLLYESVYQLKRAFPDLTIIINGGIKSIEQSKAHLKQVDGVMVGREAYKNPYLLADVDAILFNDALFNNDVLLKEVPKAPTRREIYSDYLDYCRQQEALGVPVHHLSRHILGLFHAQTGSRKFRRLISERDVNSPLNIKQLETALEAITS